MKPLVQGTACVFVLGFVCLSADLFAQKYEEIQKDWQIQVPRTHAELKAELEKCERDRRKIEAVLDATVQQGTPGLELILDVLYPESIPRPQIREEDIQTMIGDLWSEDYRTCRNAVLGLYKLGPDIEPLLEQVVKDADPIVRIWVRGIISCWEDERILDVSPYLWVLKDKIEAIRDSELLDVLASGVIVALSKRSPDRRYDKVAEYILHALAKSSNDDYSDILMPLLYHPDPGIAVLVVTAMGSGRDNRYFPPLLLQALASDRPEVVDAAISQTPNCWDKKRNAEVHSLLRKIFEGENEALKFQACFPLMHGYGDKEAVAYLLMQTQSKDRKRALTAISWIGDSCNSRKPAYPELLEKLVPFLSSEDDQIRRAAGDALGTYSGEDVVRDLIPLLGDSEEIIVLETRRSLLNQTDKVMLCRLLRDALITADNNLVGGRISELLSEIEAQ